MSVSYEQHLNNSFYISVDHSIVKLIEIEDEPGSDFINANYIPVRIKYQVMIKDEWKYKIEKIIINESNNYKYVLRLLLQTYKYTHTIHP